MINNKPPMGVIIPRALIPVNTIPNNDPEKRIIPKIKPLPAKVNSLLVWYLAKNPVIKIAKL